MLALLLSSLGFVQPAAEPATLRTSPETIVVTGQRIKEARARLKACIARGCATDEEIDASLALAETQIVAGKYRDARESLLQSLSRNKDQAARYPIPVSDLYRANGRVSAHLGYDRDYYRSTWGIYRTLKKGLPDDETRQFQAKIEVAEMMGRTRGHPRARLYYEDIAREARVAGREDIAAIAELRSAIRHLPPGMGRPIIRKIAENRDPKMRAPSLEASLALARMAYEQKDFAEADQITRTFARFKIKKPILIYAPPYQILEGELTNNSLMPGPAAQPGMQQGGGENPGGGTGRPLPPPTLSGVGQFSTTKRLAHNFEDMWVDVEFDIMPDGRVKDLEVTRKKGNTFWVEPLLGSIRERRYTPSRTAVRKHERYTYTAAYESKTETRLAGRSPAARIEFFDLTDEGETLQQ